MILRADSLQWNIVAYVTDYSHELSEVKLSEDEPTVVPVTVQDVLADYADFGEDVRKILSCLVNPTRWKLTVVWPHLPTFVNGGIALLGDAVRTISSSSRSTI